MKNLTIKDIIQFRRRSERSKLSFANSLMQNSEIKNTESGGDYWKSCVSALENSFKFNDIQFIEDKINFLEKKIENNVSNQTRSMYTRNVSILKNFLDCDLTRWRPSQEMNFIKKSSDRVVVTINGINILAKPKYVYTFQKNDIQQIAAIWFIAQLDGFRIDELSMISDLLYRYLENVNTDDFQINSDYTMAVEVYNNFELSYSNIQKGRLNGILNTTIDELNRFLN